MTAATLLGVDVGTTGVRAAAIDATGRVLGAALVPCPHQAPAPGRAEADPASWWGAVRSACARLAGSVALDRVDAVGVTGQAPTAVVVDGAGRPLRPAILWLDVRAAAEARAIEAALGPDAEAIGGNRLHAYYLGPKLAWVRAHEPELFERIALVVQPHAYVVLCLTGQAACDLSTAMLCAPLFDARARAWSERGAKAAGVPLRILPPVRRAEDVVGSVTREAALATGLREGTPVVAGGGDFAASALGAGVVDEGQACLMLGTAGNLLMPLEQARFDARLINSHHVGCDRWLSLGGTLCGAALEWFRRACAPGVSWETLEAEAAQIDPASMGRLTCIPYLQGERTPIWDEAARGMFFGIDLTHGRAHMYRALLEGIALGFRHCLSVVEERGARFVEVVAANGAGKSALLRQLLADALGVPLTWSPEAAADGDGGSAGASAGATVAGAALLAGLGCGAVEAREAGAVARPWARARASAHASPGGDVVRHEPTATGRTRLCEVFARRLALYGAVRSITD